MLGARDPSQALRHTAGSVVTTIVSAARLSTWPELLPALVEMLKSGDVGLGDGALNALLKVHDVWLVGWLVRRSAFFFLLGLCLSCLSLDEL